MANKNFGSKIVHQKNTCPKNVDKKNCSGRNKGYKLFLVQENLDNKKIWSKIVIQILFWRTYFGPNLWLKRMLNKSIRSNKNVVQKYFGPKKYWSENILVIKSVLKICPKSTLVQKRYDMVPK